MKVVVLVPYRGDGGRREDLWFFTKVWLDRNHPNWEIFQGESPEGSFNRGAAINDAARKAGDWDVAIVHDADNISDPDTLELAVQRAHETGGCVFPFSTYLYLDEFSTDRLIDQDNWFVAPLRERWAVISEHCSGIQVLSRTAYDKVGGFPELEGWGHEDCVMGQLLKAFAGGTEHLWGAAYHLWHGDGSDPERAKYGDINRQVLADVLALSVVPDQLKEYLRTGGHPIP
jgi:hypothetical protein